MARIRSIKPEFFQSETIAALPISARLTFIGLWTHADDNGVCLDNVRLITAAVWPLEEDPTLALKRTEEDLRALRASGLIVRYASPDGRRLVFVAHWDEHQKISHPRKPRYVRPTPEQLAPADESTTSDFLKPPETLGKDSGNPPEDPQRAPEDYLKPPEILRPEQGAGSREQGREKTSSPPNEPAGDDDLQGFLLEPTAGDYPAALPSTAPNRDWTNAQIDADPMFAAFWDAYPRKTDKGHGRKTWLKVVRSGVSPQTLITAAQRFRDNPDRNRDIKFLPHPGTWLNGERWDDQTEADAPTGETAWWDA